MADCRKCLYGATHENCGGCLVPEGYDVGLEGGRYAYRNYVEGDPSRGG